MRHIQFQQLVPGPGSIPQQAAEGPAVSCLCLCPPPPCTESRPSLLPHRHPPRLSANSPFRGPYCAFPSESTARVPSTVIPRIAQLLFVSPPTYPVSTYSANQSCTLHTSRPSSSPPISSTLRVIDVTTTIVGFSDTTAPLSSNARII
ncbi:hypothetical protein GALMADRAFT_849434 [Galerina marginata CBS 339.88]|uniref:Uncharacterized protein n=1 Tax=Galerina marginata (strain CBS 339.88) TaxID=685588 RepID=A0A067TSB0_GALM3|nr:hypothetical protein GALMADRAFT_849434 [Galerina marginata CBS 339.88]